MAAVAVDKFLRIACLWLLLAPMYTGVLGSDSRCTGECSCELGATCRFNVDASTTLQVTYQLNQTTEKQVSLEDRDSLSILNFELNSCISIETD